MQLLLNRSAFCARLAQRSLFGLASAPSGFAARSPAVGCKRVVLSPRFFFSQGPDNVEQQELYDHFFGTIKQSLQRTVADPTKYQNAVIYYNKIGGEFVKGNAYSSIVTSGIWMILSVVTYQFVHPYAAVIPGWFFTGGMLKVSLGFQFLQKISQKIVLHKSKESVSITQANNKQIHCKIKDISLNGIYEKTRRGLRPISSKNVTKDNLEQFLISYNLVDESGRKYIDLRILISDEFTLFENVPLFIAIIQGDHKKVAEFEQVFDNAKNEPFVPLAQQLEETADQIEDQTQAVLKKLRIGASQKSQEKTQPKDAEPPKKI